MTPTTHVPGIITLFFAGTEGANARFYECRDGRAKFLGERTDPSGTAVLWPAAAWDCERLQRRFAATAMLPDGTFLRGLTDVRTRSCAHRFTVQTPARVRPGSTAAVRVLDSFELGGATARLCVAAPGAKARCELLRFPPAVTVRSSSVAFDRPGRWRIALRTDYGTTRRTVGVGRRAGPSAGPAPGLLATGDSTMTGVESFIADELGARADVISAVLPGGRISGEENGWLQVARDQVDRDHPDVVVLSVGANEGFGIPDGDRVRQCCYPAWVTAYARRMRAVLRAYRQGGRASVLVATIPLPRFADRTEVFTRVNEGIRKAAAGLGGVQVVAMDEVFTPDGYRETVPYRGRQVAVRASDGIHLNVSGQAIAARVIEAALELPRAADRRRVRAGPARAPAAG